MGKLLPHFWNLTQLYETTMVLLMGLDIAEYPLYDQFDVTHIQGFIANGSPSKFITAHALPLLMNICREGSRHQHNKDSKSGINTDIHFLISFTITAIIGSISMNKVQYDLVLLLNELYKTRSDFKESCSRQEVLDDMVEILFQSLGKGSSGEDLLTVEEEIQQKEESTNFDDYCTTPSSATTSTYSPIDGKGTMVFTDDLVKNVNSNPLLENGSIIKRGGTSTLVTKTSPHLNKKSGAMVTRLRSASWSQHVVPSKEVVPLVNPALEALLQFLVDISIASVTDSSDKNLTVMNMVMNAYPPSTLEAQMKFESYLLTYISQNLKSTLQFDSKLLASNVILINVSKFCQLAADAVLQGRFIDGAEQTYDLLATILETLYSMDTGGGGLVGRRGLSDQTISTLYKAFNRMVLLKISDLEQGGMEVGQIVAFLNYCIHHQKIILSTRNTDQEFLRCFCYHLYQFLSSPDDTIKMDALNVWKLLLLQKPDAVSNVFKTYTGDNELLEGFSKMLETDQDSFFVWVDSRKVDLNMLFKEHVYKSWENIIIQENKYSRETWKNHQTRRIAKLKKIQKRQTYESDIFTEYTTKTAIWSKSIQEVEISRFTKALQDNDGHDNFIQSEWARINGDLTRERAIWGPKHDSETAAATSKWALDFTEGRFRMRKKIRRICEGPGSVYLPKHTSSGSSSPPTTTNSHEVSYFLFVFTNCLTDTDFCIILDDDENQNLDNENDDDLSYEEDKNQKVLRLLDPGDMVLDVYNVSQIEGLDAREGLLLICKNHIYLVDNFFQRADGEVVEIWDVPKHERDEYLLLLAQAAGMETEHSVGSAGDLHTCRKWSTADLREVFKRRFLFRDVALELFFADGQNALITVERPERDDLFTKLANRVTTASDNMTGSIFGAIDKESSTLGSKFTSIFGSSTLHDLTSKWERREITNFQYLIYINAIAGRSYNDLTQYPVFPWILADYTSENLDLTDPKTFRDLTKPMGAQTHERRVEFQDRYRQWGEINDPAPAFHYGTHYSSAMIVCSFLIRLEPFTQHYLKLQGGSFDHADRLFDSVGKAWESASEKNMGDVRELIPEFFCLPEFLENVNKFNFGTKQGTGETIDSVTLPPWASGDSKIFIQRHREALESDYVSENLHHWIDLIFGHKQQGKAAIDSINVFHHVSYEGAVDLDAITDIVEKKATIGIINNFGQTPRQLFKKPHPARLPPTKDPLALGFYPLRDYLQKLIQSVCPLRGVAACQQLFMIPDGQHYIEWGFSDNSLRLYSTDPGKVKLNQSDVNRLLETKILNV
ncbi:hypothetical protein BCR42DRAFT_315828 [Absidia repens]|uniref:BEACH domain-containing protein n=1 Tax=Absidia repens TaxID=90262 RepID=A0A1X2J4H8_9FUNG|nr:hypothetical protein BCR42DRAFT_315828 [Absidia repens]